MSVQPGRGPEGQAGQFRSRLRLVESYERIVTKGHGDALCSGREVTEAWTRKAVVEVERRDLSAI